jgi:hypothetical protein
LVRFAHDWNDGIGIKPGSTKKSVISINFKDSGMTNL